MRIAVEGCAHGELERIYETVLETEKYTGKKIDLLICCGDFQAIRNKNDLACIAISDKFKGIGSFHNYYSGQKVAPVLTLFIGGNHEASNHLQELSYGGWVAPNIYYLGYAGVVNIGGLRIAGISGIYKGYDYSKGHFERLPYTPKTLRSVYHIRNLEVFRLKQLSGDIDIFMSHDWPLGITRYGDSVALLKTKPFLRDEVHNHQLGNPPIMEILKQHRPTYWFSAHMHCKFAAIVQDENVTKFTKFLSLDKCLPHRKFLQVVEIEHNKDVSLDLKYDLEWLCILYSTNHLLSVKKGINYMPQSKDPENNFVPAEDIKELILKKFNHDLNIPKNFTQSAEIYNPNDISGNSKMPNLQLNDQTTTFCSTLGIDDPLALLSLMDTSIKTSEETNNSKDSSLIDMKSSFEHSFISDSISDSFSSDCLQVVMDKVCDVNELENHHILSPLKLPAASYETANDENEISLNEKIIITNKYVEEQLNEKSLTTEEDETPKKSASSFKKFKRRNQSIYADTSSEF